MTMILDASMALAWLIVRADATEAALASRAFVEVQSTGAHVPALWFAEVANTLLVFERAKRLNEADSTNYLADVALLAITADDLPFATALPRCLSLGRGYNLSAYDSTYLELAMRRSGVLATFDRKLAEAARKVGVQVFGDPI